MRIAAVIASYNQVDYIDEAVRSLLDQVDEVVVVDDASTDGTVEALESIDSGTLTILRNGKQRGVSYSFNRAVEATTAEVLLIQGGDDRSLPGRAAAQADALADPAVALVHSVPRVIDQRGLALPPELASEFLAKPASSDPLTFLFFESNYICAPSAAVRRADYQRHGGFPAGIDLLQDYALWLELAAGGAVLDLGEPVVEYRKHGTNLSREYVGLDSPKRRRLSAEMEFVRNRFLDQCDEATVLGLAAQCGLDPGWASSVDPADLRMLIRLSHKDKLVSRRGLSALFEIAASPDAEGRLTGLRLDADDLTRFSILADHDNLEDVGRALAVVRSLAQNTDPRE